MIVGKWYITFIICVSLIISTAKHISFFFGLFLIKEKILYFSSSSWHLSGYTHQTVFILLETEAQGLRIFHYSCPSSSPFGHQIITILPLWNVLSLLLPIYSSNRNLVTSLSWITAAIYCIFLSPVPCPD